MGEPIRGRIEVPGQYAGTFRSIAGRGVAVRDQIGEFSTLMARRDDEP